MKITNTAKVHLKNLSTDLDGTPYQIILTFDDSGTIRVDWDRPVAMCGFQHSFPLYIHIPLGLKDTPFLLIEAGSEKFFRASTLDVDKFNNLVVTHGTDV